MELTFVYARSFDATAKRSFRNERERDHHMRDAERQLLANPEAGEVMQGTGGARKLRVAMPGRGKRGGARAIYVYLRFRRASILCCSTRKATCRR